MSVAKPTVAQIRGRIADAEEGIRQADAHFAQIAYEKIADPAVDTRPALATLEGARADLASLEAALPLAEQAEAAALAETRAALAEERRKRLEKELKAVVAATMQFTAHYSNAAGAFRRAVAAADRARSLLPDEIRRRGPGWENALTAHQIHRACQDEMNRIGLVPAISEGAISAPGARPDRVDMQFANAPHRIPSLEASTKKFVMDLMAAVTPASKRQESGNAPDLPREAQPEHAPTASDEAFETIAAAGPVLAVRDPKPKARRLLAERSTGSATHAMGATRGLDWVGWRPCEKSLL